jgi:hypothetical protein
MDDDNDFEPAFKKPSIQPQKSRIKPLAEDTIAEEAAFDDDEIQFLDNLYKKSTFKDEIIVLENNQPSKATKKDDSFFSKPKTNDSFLTKTTFNKENSICDFSILGSNKSKFEPNTSIQPYKIVSTLKTVVSIDNFNFLFTKINKKEISWIISDTIQLAAASVNKTRENLV